MRETAQPVVCSAHLITCDVRAVIRICCHFSVPCHPGLYVHLSLARLSDWEMTFMTVWCVTINVFGVVAVTPVPSSVSLITVESSSSSTRRNVSLFISVVYVDAATA